MMTYQNIQRFFMINKSALVLSIITPFFGKIAAFFVHDFWVVTAYDYPKG